MGTGALDLAGLGLAQAFTETFTVAGTGSLRQSVYRVPHPGEVSTSTIGNLFGFHGLPLDPETGFYHARRRHYDPELGRFVQTDPMGHADAPSLYQYGLNNPVNYSDPTGEIVETAWDVTSLTIGVISFAYNVRQGNWGTAGLDAFGIVVDAAAVATPFVPGGAGALLQARRMKQGVDVLQLADQALNIGQGVYQARAAYQEGHYGYSAFYAGMSALGVRGVARSPIRVRADGLGSNLGNLRLEYGHGKTGRRVLFGQRRVGTRFSKNEKVPDHLRGRLVSEVARDLRAGRLSPDDLPINAFRVEGELVSANTRTLAALSEAGLQPTVINRITPSEDLLKRLKEAPLIPSSLPGPRVPMTRTRRDLEVLRVIELPGGGG